MPKFTIIETVPCIQQWTYKIEAATEEEAITKIMSGEAQILSSEVTEHDYYETSYEVMEHENKLVDEINEALQDGYDNYEEAE